uniref:Putative secreted protein n=1 Tax=Anopheles darlingi TaxID=43151 RepID=A0A2M4D9V4_ANODA
MMIFLPLFLFFLFCSILHKQQQRPVCGSVQFTFTSDAANKTFVDRHSSPACDIRRGNTNGIVRSVRTMLPLHRQHDDGYVVLNGAGFLRIQEVAAANRYRLYQDLCRTQHSQTLATDETKGSGYP